MPYSSAVMPDVPPHQHDPTQGTPESIGSSDSSPDQGVWPDEEMLEAQQAQLRRRLNGAGAAILILEALAVLFVPRAIAQTGPGLTTGRLLATLAVVVLLIVVAVLQRRPWGPRAGLAVQLPVLATGFFTAAMWFLGALFVLLWAYLMRIRAELLAAPPASPPEVPAKGDG